MRLVEQGGWSNKVVDQTASGRSEGWWLIKQLVVGQTASGKTEIWSHSQWWNRMVVKQLVFDQTASGKSVSVSSKCGCGDLRSTWDSVDKYKS